MMTEEEVRESLEKAIRLGSVTTVARDSDEKRIMNSEIDYALGVVASFALYISPEDSRWSAVTIGFKEGQQVKFFLLTLKGIYMQ